MKTVHLLTAAAAASLLLATGAGAADKKGSEMSNPAPAAQQNAPAEKMGSSINAGHSGKSETTGQGSTERLQEKSEPNGAEHTGVENRAGRHNRGETREQSSPENNNVNNREHRGGVSNESATQQNRKETTTGQGAASGSAKLTGEQRTKITTIIKKQHVQPAHVNFSVQVGARVPRSVHFYPLPTEVVEVYPEWRGYDYILVGDQIIVIDPRSDEIVAILET
jgi:hypothetical protein